MINQVKANLNNTIRAIHAKKGPFDSAKGVYHSHIAEYAVLNLATHFEPNILSELGDIYKEGTLAKPTTPVKLSSFIMLSGVELDKDVVIEALPRYLKILINFVKNMSETYPYLTGKVLVGLLGLLSQSRENKLFIDTTKEIQSIPLLNSLCKNYLVRDVHIANSSDHLINVINKYVKDTEAKSCNLTLKGSSTRPLLNIDRVKFDIDDNYAKYHDLLKSTYYCIDLDSGGFHLGSTTNETAMLLAFNITALFRGASFPPIRYDRLKFSLAYHSENLMALTTAMRFYDRELAGRVLLALYIEGCHCGDEQARAKLTNFILSNNSIKNLAMETIDSIGLKQSNMCDEQILESIVSSGSNHYEYVLPELAEGVTVNV